jgi:transposase-like protein
MDTPQTLQQAIQYFSDEQTCIDAVAFMRWPDGPRCPYCVGEDAKNPYYIKTAKRWKCRSCRNQFSVKKFTIFEDSPISLQKWLPALWMLVSCKNGISSYEIHRAIGVSQKTAWFMLHRLRLALKAKDLGFKLGGKDGSGVETDECFVGGRVQNMHRNKHTKYMLDSRGPNFNKTIVHGILDRDLRQVRASVVPDTKRETLQNQILKNVKFGSTVYTDAAVAYESGLQRRFIHDVVDKTQTYVRGRVHVNGMENFWALMKRSLKGTYVAVEPFHLERYVDEQVFRFNNRATKDNPLTDADRFLLALSQVAGKRLTFAELTGKDKEIPF